TSKQSLTSMKALTLTKTLTSLESLASVWRPSRARRRQELAASVRDWDRAVGQQWVWPAGAVRWAQAAPEHLNPASKDRLRGSAGQEPQAEDPSSILVALGSDRLRARRLRSRPARSTGSGSEPAPWRLQVERSDRARVPMPADRSSQAQAACLFRS